MSMEGVAKEGKQVYLMHESNKSNETKSWAMVCQILVYYKHYTHYIFYITRTSALLLSTVYTQFNLILRTTVRVNILCLYFSDQKT